MVQLTLTETQSLKVFSDGSIFVESQPKVRFRVPHDTERVNWNLGKLDYFDGNGVVRSPVTEGGEPLPEVYRVLPFHHVVLDCHWQNVWRDLNPMLSPKRFCTLFGNRLAWCNGSGFPGHRNCILNEEVNLSFPRFDQARLQGGAIVSGETRDGKVYIESALISQKISVEELVERKLWYYATSINPRGQINYITRLGVDGKYHPVKIPNLTSVPIYLPASHLHKLPEGFNPDPRWVH